MNPLRSLLFFTATFAFCLSGPTWASDRAVTAASVIGSTSADVSEGIAGETITAGQPIYKDSTDSGKLKLADANVLAKIQVVGISLHGASTGQPLKFAKRDATFTGGFTVAAGEPVFLSATAGGICPFADVTTGSYTVFLGVGIGSNKIYLSPVVGGLVP